MNKGIGSEMCVANKNTIESTIYKNYLYCVVQMGEGLGHKYMQQKNIIIKN